MIFKKICDTEHLILSRGVKIEHAHVHTPLWLCFFITCDEVASWDVVIAEPYMTNFT